MVQVYTKTYKEIFKEFRNIIIPEYQRPYSWTAEKTEDLLTDLEEFFIAKPNENLEYYMGSILFYKKGKKLEIIDGQQRITTLIILQFVLNNRLASTQNLQFNSHISFKNVDIIKKYLTDRLSLIKDLEKLSFFSRLRFTVIISDSEDNAFAFFDSQNNRGVTLGADDYLKAFHLREVESLKMQESLAQQWEQITFNSQKEKKEENSLLHLLYKILYRSRKWQGQNNIIPESKERILLSFQKQTHKSISTNHFPLFANKNNIRYSAIQYSESAGIELNKNENEIADKAVFPFSIRQPIYKGVNFFQFIEKYHAIHQMLFNETNTISNRIIQTQEYYSFVYSNNMSIFLRHYMQLCIVMYYDSFGDNKLYQAIQYFDYFIGSIRIEKYYVRQEAIKNSLTKETTNNLLDVIANAYLPEEIFEFIKAQQHVSKTYKEEELEDDNGVRNQYKQRIVNYYNQDKNSFTNRILWIK